MGWSEQYWEDVKSELVRPATEPEAEPAGEDATLSRPARPGVQSGATGDPSEAAHEATDGERP